MQIVCQKQPLVEAVTNVSRAVSAKNTMTVLEGILIRAQAGKLFLTGYDLELAILTSVDADITEDGEIVLSAKVLLDVIRKMPSDDISISSDEKLLTLIKSGMTEYTILGIPADDYPELPTVSQTSSFTILQSTLKNMINQTLFAIAVSDNKPVHTGSMFDIKNSELHVVSVDGYRLALRSEKLATDSSISFIVPGKSLSEVSKLLKDEDTETELNVSKGHIIFKINGYHIISRLLEGDFLDYHAAIPAGGQTSIKVGTRDLINSIERTSLLISDSIKSPLRMGFKDGLIMISCSTSLGKAYDEISGEQDGANVQIGFNSKYMLDALKASDSDKIVMVMNGPLSPIKLIPIEGDSFIFLVLPVRLKAE